MSLTIRTAKRKDTSLILHFIRELAAFEKLAHEVVATEAILEKSLFDAPVTSHALIAEHEGRPIGFCIYFYNFSTFLGRKGIYIEDIYIILEMRGRGFGQQFFSYLAQKALDEDCGRVEWWVLDENISAVEFYQKIGAQAMHEWTVQRLEGKTLQAMAKKI